jgi:hypothetical protein
VRTTPAACVDLRAGGGADSQLEGFGSQPIGATADLQFQRFYWRREAQVPHRHRDPRNRLATRSSYP